MSRAASPEPDTPHSATVIAWAAWQASRVDHVPPEKLERRGPLRLILDRVKAHDGERHVFLEAIASIARASMEKTP